MRERPRTGLSIARIAAVQFDMAATVMLRDAVRRPALALRRPEADLAAQTAPPAERSPARRALRDILEAGAP